MRTVSSPPASPEDVGAVESEKAIWCNTIANRTTMRQRRQYLDEELARVFESYDRSVPGLDPSLDFLPGIWRRIEQRRSLGWLAPLQLWSPRLAAAGALAAAILVGSLWLSSRTLIDSALLEESYVDALTAESMDEHDGSLWVQAGNRR